MAETSDIYGKLATMYEQEDPAGIGGPITPAFMKVLNLQFTKVEANIALKMRFTGGKLDDISEKTSITRRQHTKENTKKRKVKGKRRTGRNNPQSKKH